MTVIFRLLQLSVGLAVLLQSGPLAPCKLENFLLGHGLREAAAEMTAPFSDKSLQPFVPRSTQNRGDDEDPDESPSCWCSIHMSMPDSLGFDASPAFAMLLSPVSPILFIAQPTAIVGLDVPTLEPPWPHVGHSLPLLI